MSTIKVNSIQNTSGVEVYTAKAWVNFNGTGTVAIRASGNVSSITDNGTGDYKVNFTTPMQDTNYAYSLSCSENNDIVNSTVIFPVASGILTTSFQVRTNGPANGYQTVSWTNNKQDKEFVSVAIFR